MSLESKEKDENKRKIRGFYSFKTGCVVVGDMTPPTYGKWLEELVADNFENIKFDTTD